MTPSEQIKKNIEEFTEKFVNDTEFKVSDISYEDWLKQANIQTLESVIEMLEVEKYVVEHEYALGSENCTPRIIRRNGHNQALSQAINNLKEEINKIEKHKKRSTYDLIIKDPHTDKLASTAIDYPIEHKDRLGDVIENLITKLI